MVKQVIHDSFFLAQKSSPATTEDLNTGVDLLETLIAHKDTCVGMAANMIGATRCIIAFNDGGVYTVMYNPKIISFSQPYTTKEGCLSLLGEPRECKRYQKIKVQWQTEEFKLKIKTFSGFTAQIIQHEIDHCNGILI